MSLVSAQVDRTAFNLDFNFDSTPQSSTTPIPILRQVDRQNPDGSYTYGYESGDGTYKIETRYATGEVKGKYGYYDDLGVLREVNYGATPTGGFEPVGNGLNLPEPEVLASTPVVEESGRRINVIRRKRPQSSVVVNEAPRRSNDPRVLLPENRRNGDRQAASRTINSNLQIRPRTTTTPRPEPEPQFVQPNIVQQPQFNAARFDGHPAQNIDLDSGSYTIFYSGR